MRNILDVTDHEFYITLDQIDGVKRLNDRFGKRMAEDIVRGWFVDHGMIPGKEIDMRDGFYQLDSGIVIKARIFNQSHNYFGMY